MVSAMVAPAIATQVTLGQLAKAEFAWHSVICTVSVKTALVSVRRVGKAQTVTFLLA
jgi:hypothetical protein